MMEISVYDAGCKLPDLSHMRTKNFPSRLLRQPLRDDHNRHSRSAAQRFVLFSEYTYTLETIIQAGQKNMLVRSVPIRVNPDLRPSRLVKNVPSYIRRSILTIVRIFVIYRPARFFGFLALLLLGPGFLIALRFLFYYFSGTGTGHVQSLILAAILLIVGFQTLLVAFLADVIAANRKLLEDIRFRQKAATEPDSRLSELEPTEHRADHAKTLEGRPTESDPILR